MGIPQGLSLLLRGLDLLDGTPVLDVKPYVPYADAIAEAHGGFAVDAPGGAFPVAFTAQAEREIAAADPDGALELRLLVTQVLEQDPRPGYMDRYPERRAFGMRLYEMDVRWELTDRGALVTEVTNRAATDGQ